MTNAAPIMGCRKDINWRFLLGGLADKYGILRKMLDANAELKFNPHTGYYVWFIDWTIECDVIYTCQAPFRGVEARFDLVAQYPNRCECLRPASYITAWVQFAKKELLQPDVGHLAEMRGMAAFESALECYKKNAHTVDDVVWHIPRVWRRQALQRLQSYVQTQVPRQRHKPDYTVRREGIPWNNPYAKRRVHNE